MLYQDYLDALLEKLQDKNQEESLKIIQEKEGEEKALALLNLSESLLCRIVENTNQYMKFKELFSTLLQGSNISAEAQQNALRNATHANNLDAIQLLLDAGATAVNHDPNNALPIAAKNGFTEIVHFLLKKFKDEQAWSWKHWQTTLALGEATQRATTKVLLDDHFFTTSEIDSSIAEAIRKLFRENKINVLIEQDLEPLAILYICYAKRENINLYDCKTDDELLDAISKLRNHSYCFEHLMRKIQLKPKFNALFTKAVKEELAAQRKEAKEQRVALLSAFASVWQFQEEDEIKEDDESLKISQAQSKPSAQPQAPSQPTIQEVANALPAFESYKSKPANEKISEDTKKKSAILKQNNGQG